MFKHYFWLILLLANITIPFTNATNVQAAASTYEQTVPASTNIGNFIYEDKEYLTQKQVDQINAMNQKNIQQADHQYITLVIVNKIPLKDYPNITDVEQRQYYLNNLQEKFKDEDQNRRNTIADTTFNERLEQGRNFLLVSIKDKKIYFFGDHQLENYLTDYKIWQMQLPINLGIQPRDPDKQVENAIKLMKKINTTIKPIANFDEHYEKSLSFKDIQKKFSYVGNAIKGFFLIMLAGTIIAIILAIVFQPTNPGLYYIFSRFYRD